MADPEGQLKKKLRSLALAARHRVADADRIGTHRLPDDLCTPQLRWLSLSREVDDLHGQLVELLLSQPKFEHLGDKAVDAVWRYFYECASNRDDMGVNRFLAAHRRELMTLECFVEVEALAVTTALEVGRVTLLPQQTELPPPKGGVWDPAWPGCVARVRTSGTHYGNMANRARAEVARALDVIRLLASHPPVMIVGSDRQLRFRVGMYYLFEDGRCGWSLHRDETWPLYLDPVVGDALEASPLKELTVEPSNDFERKAQVALRWLSDAWRATEPEVVCLYSFFALEAILGDKSDGLKAPNLAYRRAMLDHLATGTFRSPQHVIFLYKEVRSVAVHGGEIKDVDAGTASRFRDDTRQAVEQYVRVGSDEAATRQRRVVDILDRHPDGDELRSFVPDLSGERGLLQRLRRRWPGRAGVSRWLGLRPRRRWRARR